MSRCPESKRTCSLVSLISGGFQYFAPARDRQFYKSFEQLQRLNIQPGCKIFICLVLNNYEFHKLLTEGVDVSYREGSQQRHAKLWLVDTARPHYNDWLAVNQFTVEIVNPLTRTRTNRRPDIVLFVNGLPLAVIELKNAADEDANPEAAYHQLQTYKDEISSPECDD